MIAPLLCLAAVVPTPQEVEVPAFHTEKAPASYVLTAAAGHDPRRAAPLILDFHGAARPSRKGANITQAGVWKAFVTRVPALVLGLNARTRAWGMVKDPEQNDVAYALHVLAAIRARHALVEDEIYLAGFSSGSDFLCSNDLQLRARFAGSLVVCPGPTNVVGLRGGELIRKKDHPFYFVTGEEDYIRKNGAWQAFLALERAGGVAMYREVPGVGHRFPPTEEYARAFHHLRQMAGKVPLDHLTVGEDAFERGDFLLASTHLAKVGSDRANELLAEIESKGKALLARADALVFADDPGRAFESWWRLRTQFHRFPEIASRAQAQLDRERAISNRDLFRARRAFFAGRDASPPPPTPKAAPNKAAPKKKPPPPPARTATPPRAKKPPTAVGPWAFDRYLSFDEVQDRLQRLARENPGRVRLTSMGQSIQGRDLWVCEITNRDTGPAEAKPAAYVQGGIHGNEISAVMNALYFAWQMGDNPDRRRSIDKLLRETTLYVAPAVSPDAVQHFATRPNSLWRPRFNFRPHDADGDGALDEDPYEDLNGDGEISHMYRAAPDGTFILRDGRLVRGEGTPRYEHVGREGLDNDGDGKFSEDPPGGVNLNRNFPVGFRARRDFEGFRGAGPASEPETRAIVKFVRAHRNISLFLDYHNAAKCVFYWLGEEGGPEHKQDFELHAQLAARAREKLGYVPRPLRHSGVGLSVAWAYGELGIPAAIVELEATRLPEKQYFEEVWKGEVFVDAVPFQHPQLGAILLGNDHRKLPKRNPHPSDILWQVQRSWDWLRNELKRLPELAWDQPRIQPVEGGFVVTGSVANTGLMPMATQRADSLGLAEPIRITAKGARIAGVTELAPLAAGERAEFDVALSEVQASATLVVSHPKAGVIELPIVRPRVATVAVRKSYTIEPGYRTVADCVRADNAFYEKGVSQEERGPTFALRSSGNALKVAVLLGEFEDRKHSVPARAFEDAFFADGTYVDRSSTGQRVYGSLRDFYRESSYGEMTVDGTVFAWMTVPGKFDDYRKASFGSSKFRDALEKAVLAKHGPDALDGYDGIVFLWAGNPVHRVSCLWPMRLNLKHRPGVASFKAGELYRGQMGPIGVACHEMGHTFGVNDKYGLGAPERPMGKWCLMCKGTHGAGESMRHRPFHLCAWCKMVVGWVEPVVVDPAVPQQLALRPILYAPDECYRILLKPDGSEYLLLENRRREGFMTEIPSPGLVVLKVGPNTRPSAPQKQVQLWPAHGLPPSSRSDLSKPEEVAWPQDQKTELVIDGVRLSGIRRVDGVIYFRLDRAK